MSVDRAIAALKQANGYRAVQGYLSGLNLTSGVGWENISANLAQHVDDELLSEDDLEEFVIDVHSRANKLVVLYSVKKTIYDELWAMAKASEDVVDNDVDFPWLLNDDDLAELDEQPRHVYTRKTEAGYELFFTSARMGVDTDDIPIEKIVTKEREHYKGARLYVERVTRRQAFDVIFIPQDSRLVQMRIDTGGVSGNNRDSVRAFLETAVVSSARVGAAKFQPVNIFKAVSSIYDDEDEGNITGLNFNYATGSLTHRLRRAKDGPLDLREDAFHVGGVEKVDRENMELFWLSVELADPSSDDGETVIVTLPGGVRHLKGAPLWAFAVDTFASEAAIAYAAEVIFKHVDEAT